MFGVSRHKGKDIRTVVSLASLAFEEQIRQAPGLVTESGRCALGPVILTNLTLLNVLWLLQMNLTYLAYARVGLQEYSAYLEWSSELLRYAEMPVCGSVYSTRLGAG